MFNQLKIFRDKHGISQEKLALALKVSRQTIISIESGRYKPSLTLAYQMANFFDTTIENLFFKEVQ